MRVSTFDMLEGGEVFGELVSTEPSPGGFYRIKLDDGRVVARKKESFTMMKKEEWPRG